MRGGRAPRAESQPMRGQGQRQSSCCQSISPFLPPVGGGQWEAKGAPLLSQPWRILLRLLLATSAGWLRPVQKPPNPQLLAGASRQALSRALPPAPWPEPSTAASAAAAAAALPAALARQPRLRRLHESSFSPARSDAPVQPRVLGTPGLPGLQPPPPRERQGERQSLTQRGGRGAGPPRLSR